MIKTKLESRKKKRVFGARLQSEQRHRFYDVINYWRHHSTFTGSKPEPTTTTTNSTSDDVINVFSLASGHLYERLMRIMMLSVIRHTKTRVKFWMLKNYLSPQFKVSSKIVSLTSSHHLPLRTSSHICLRSMTLSLKWFNTNGRDGWTSKPRSNEPCGGW